MTLSGTGVVQLGSGNLTTNDLASGISGGSLSAAYQYVGNGGTGTFTQSGGASTIGNCLYLGYNAGDSGAYNLSGSGQLSASYEYVGYSGTGSFTQSGGTNSVGNYLYLGDNAGGAVSGGHTASAAAASCRRTTSTWAIPARGPSRSRAGPTVRLDILYLGNNSGGSGTYSLSGSGQLSASYEYVGNSGTGSFTQSGGTNSIGNYLYLGANAGGSGAYSLSGSGQLSASYEYVGSSGTGSFTQIGRDQQHRQLSLSRQQLLRRQRHVQPQRQRPVVGRRRIRRLVRHAAAFAQTGGTNATSLLSIGSNGSYLLAGGLLQVNGSLLNQGTFSGGGTAGHARRQRHSGPHQRHLAEPGEHLA